MRTGRIWAGLGLTLGLLTGCQGATDPHRTVSAGSGEAMPALDQAALADEVRAAMDPGVDPCQDFYAYACGGWSAAQQLPADEARRVRGFSAVRERNLDALGAIVEDDGLRGEQAKMYRFHAACMDEATIEQRGLEPLRPLLRTIDAIEQPGDLMQALGELHRRGFQAAFATLIFADLDRAERDRVHLTQSGLGLPDRQYYLAEHHGEVLEAYRDHVTRMLEQVGVADAEDASRRVLSLERRLAEASRPRARMQRVEEMNNPIDREGLAKLTPRLEWDRYFAALGQSRWNELNLLVPEFFQQLDEALVAGGPQSWRDYLRWHVARRAAPWLTGELNETLFDFYGRVLNGQQQPSSRRERCIRLASGLMGDLLAEAYVQRSFPGDSKERAQELSLSIQAELDAALAELGWVDAETLERATAKRRTLLAQIGYPERWDGYDGLEIRDDDHFGNVLRALEFGVTRELSRIGAPVDRGRWYLPATAANAYYDPTRNQIVFPAGILQPPFFHRFFPDAMNYGGIGVLFGHEVIHGFDAIGRKFDPDGRADDWWSAEASLRYEERAECVDAVYGGFEVQPGLPVNGRLTLVENVADIGGLKLAYRAYRRQAANSPQPPLLEELDGDRLFFVAFAQTWCTLQTPEAERRANATGTHAPPRFRVVGAVSQMSEFADAFECAPGTPMSPPDRCEVW